MGEVVQGSGDQPTSTALITVLQSVGTDTIILEAGTAYPYDALVSMLGADAVAALQHTGALTLPAQTVPANPPPDLAQDGMLADKLALLQSLAAAETAMVTEDTASVA